MSAQARVRRSHAPDYGLLTTVLVLLIVGLIFVYSSSYVMADLEFGDPNHFIKRQFMFAILGTLFGLGIVAEVTEVDGSSLFFEILKR